MKYAIRPNAKDDILRQFRYYLLEGALVAANSFLDALILIVMKAGIHALA